MLTIRVNPNLRSTLCNPPSKFWSCRGAFICFVLDSTNSIDPFQKHEDSKTPLPIHQPSICRTPTVESRRLRIGFNAPQPICPLVYVEVIPLILFNQLLYCCYIFFTACSHGDTNRSTSLKRESLSLSLSSGWIKDFELSPWCWWDTSLLVEYDVLLPNSLIMNSYFENSLIVDSFFLNVSYILFSWVTLNNQLISIQFSMYAAYISQYNVVFFSCKVVFKMVSDARL